MRNRTMGINCTLSIVQCKLLKKAAQEMKNRRVAWFHLLCEIVAIHLFSSVNGYMVGDNPYHQKVTLDSRGKYELEWLVDHENGLITFNVSVLTHGYVGFGLSRNGKMTGADIVIGGVMPSGKWYFTDRHAVANQLPEIDPSQDWTLHEARETDKLTFLSFSRAFDTCDPQDYPITEDKVSVIWAFGEKDHQLAYHHGNRGVYDLYLLHPNYSPKITCDPISGQPQIEHNGGNVEEQDRVNVWTINTVMELPDRDTSYWCTMHKAPTLPRKHHVIGLDVRLPDSNSVQHTHHLLLHKCNAPKGSSARQMFHSFLNYRGQECLMVKSPTGPMPTEYCTEFYQSWAVGGRPIFHPPHVGIPLGTDEDEYHLLQIHFDNPNRLSGVIVNVSLDMFYTSEIRPHDGGLLMLRHESPGLTPSLLIPPSSIDHKIYGMCGDACTQAFLPPEGIRIYAMLLHSHNAGKEIRLQQFRGKTELPWVLSDENYSFNYQQWRVLTKEATVLPGDLLAVRCIYDSTMVNGTVVGGFSTRQEMCVAFGYYYNKIANYQQCSSEIDSPEARERFLGIRNVTWSNTKVEYIVTPPHPLAEMKISEVSDNFVDWNVERREELQHFHLNHPHINRCPRELYSLEESSEKVVNGGDWRYAKRSRKLSDGTSENSEDDSRRRIVLYPFWTTPFEPKQRCVRE